MPLSTEEKCAEFQKMHESGCFILPNAIDVGSAKALQHLGFKAIASMSAGFAWTIGKPDNRVSLEDVCQHLTSLSAAVDIPVNADFEGGFAREPDEVEINVARGATTGVAGLSIEDSTGDQSAPLFDLQLSVDRIRAARSAIDHHAPGVVLVARCESLLWGGTDLKLVIERLIAYSEAGADCLFAPGLHAKADIQAVVKAVHPKPLNLLSTAPNTSLAEIAGLGIRRISVGGGLARAAWSGFLRAAKEMAEDGTFSQFATTWPGAELNQMFSKSR